MKDDRDIFLIKQITTNSICYEEAHYSNNDINRYYNH